MRAIKCFLVFALLLCLTEPCLVAAQDWPGCGRRIRFEVISFLHSHVSVEIVLDIPISFLHSHMRFAIVLGIPIVNSR